MAVLGAMDRPGGEGGACAARRARARLLSFAGALVLWAGTGGPAAAEFRVCNRTENLVNLALGWPEPDQDGGDLKVHVEGWWSVAAESCASLIRRPLDRPLYWLYAVDIYGRPLVEGTVPLCVDRRAFELSARSDCWKQGYEAAGFTAVATAGFDRYILNLEAPAAAPAGAGP